MFNVREQKHNEFKGLGIYTQSSWFVTHAIRVFPKMSPSVFFNVCKICSVEVEREKTSDTLYMKH